MFCAHFICFCANSKLFAPEYLAAGAFFSAKKALLRISSFLRPSILPQAFFFRPKRRLLKFWTCIYVFFDDFR